MIAAHPYRRRFLEEPAERPGVRDEMLERGRIATRQYAKRQMTWIRNQAHINLGAHEQYSECLASRIFLEIDRFLLTLGH